MVRVMAILSLEDKEVLPCIVIYLYGEYMREKYWIPEGNPTVEVEVTVGEGIMGIDGCTGRALVPSGAFHGKI